MSNLKNNEEKIKTIKDEINFIRKKIKEKENDIDLMDKEIHCNQEILKRKEKQFDVYSKVQKEDLMDFIVDEYFNLIVNLKEKDLKKSFVKELDNLIELCTDNQERKKFVFLVRFLGENEEKTEFFVHFNKNLNISQFFKQIVDFFHIEQPKKYDLFFVDTQKDYKLRKLNEENKIKELFNKTQKSEYVELVLKEKKFVFLVHFKEKNKFFEFFDENLSFSQILNEVSDFFKIPIDKYELCLLDKDRRLIKLKNVEDINDLFMNFDESSNKDYIELFLKNNKDKDDNRDEIIPKKEIIKQKPQNSNKKEEEGGGLNFKKATQLMIKNVSFVNNTKETKQIEIEQKDKKNVGRSEKRKKTVKEDTVYNETNPNIIQESQQNLITSSKNKKDRNKNKKDKNKYKNKGTKKLLNKSDIKIKTDKELINEDEESNLNNKDNQKIKIKELSAKIVLSHLIDIEDRIITNSYIHLSYLIFTLITSLNLIYRSSNYVLYLIKGIFNDKLVKEFFEVNNNELITSFSTMKSSSDIKAWFNYIHNSMYYDKTSNITFFMNNFIMMDKIKLIAKHYKEPFIPRNNCTKGYLNDFLISKKFDKVEIVNTRWQTYSIDFGNTLEYFPNDYEEVKNCVMRSNFLNENIELGVVKLDLINMNSGIISSLDLIVSQNYFGYISCDLKFCNYYYDSFGQELYSFGFECIILIVSIFYIVVVLMAKIRSCSKVIRSKLKKFKQKKVEKVEKNKNNNNDEEKNNSQVSYGWNFIVLCQLLTLAIYCGAKISNLILNWNFVPYEIINQPGTREILRNKCEFDDNLNLLGVFNIFLIFVVFIHFLGSHVSKDLLDTYKLILSNLLSFFFAFSCTFWGFAMYVYYIYETIYDIAFGTSLTSLKTLLFIYFGSSENLSYLYQLNSTIAQIFLLNFFFTFENENKREFQLFNDLQQDKTDNANDHESFSIHSQYNNEIIVESNEKIQDAINKAKPYTRIRIKPGVYRECLSIKKGFIELESFNEDETAIILSENSPCICISDLKELETVKISYLRLANRGIRTTTMLKDTDLTKNFIYQNSNLIENLEVNYEMDSNIIEGIITENRGNISIISVFSGVAYINNCQLSLAYLSSSTNCIIPAIYSENCNIMIEEVLIKGNKEYLTVGILCYNTNCKIINSKIFGHRSGGLLMSISQFNKITINKTNCQENIGSAVLLKGHGDIIVQDNLLEKNSGCGIKAIDCNKLTVIGNKIMENLLDGAMLVNCDGLVMLNSFYKNKGNGATIVTENENGVSNVKFLKNTILENYRNGLFIKGLNNNARILQNEKIAYNNLSGVEICDKALPKLFDNKIYENLHQGILVTSDSSAIIENNTIYRNIKANIAFGGLLAENTLIKNNRIFGSRNEGIFLIQAKGGKIIKNDIYDNNDGIILMNSIVDIIENNIYGNIRTGILISNQSNPVLKSNIIHDNNFLGMFIRDSSIGSYHGNQLKYNVSQLYLSKDCKKLYNNFKETNAIEGRVDVQSNCSIF